MMKNKCKLNNTATASAINTTSRSTNTAPRTPNLHTTAKATLRRTLGFTLAEMLMTVAIIGILAAVGFTGGVRMIRSSRQSSMDSVAETMFYAAEARLNEVYVFRGEAYDLLTSDSSEYSTSGAAVATIGTQAEAGSIRYITHASAGSGNVVHAAEPSDAMQNAILPAGSVSDEYRNNGWYIEYNRTSLQVQAVFYTEALSATEFADLYTAATANSDLRTSASARMTASDGKLGYYGGPTDDYEERDTEAAAVDVRIKNAETLTAEIGVRVPSSLYDAIKNSTDGEKLNLTVYTRGEKSGALVAQTLEIPIATGHYNSTTTEVKDGETYQSYLFLVRLTLDSLTDGKKFAQTYGSINGFDSATTAFLSSNGCAIVSGDTETEKLTYDADATTAAITASGGASSLTAFIPGEDITVSARIEASDDPASASESSKTANSLFESAYLADSTYTAYIGAGRHLQNLTDTNFTDFAANYSGDAEKIAAVQTANIYFAYTDDAQTIASDWQTAYPSLSFAPIKNTALDSYSGSTGSDTSKVSYSIIDLPEDVSGNAGLFDTFYGTSLSDIRLVSPEISGSALVGGIAGDINSTGRVTISGCRLSMRESDAADKKATDVTSKWMSGGVYVGGLVGSANTQLEITDSSASTVVRATGASSAAGGLIGRTTAALTVECSYADCYIAAATVGGLAGICANGSSFTDSYSAGFVLDTPTDTVKSAAGLTPSAARVSRCYSVFYYDATTEEAAAADDFEDVPDYAEYGLTSGSIDTNSFYTYPVKKENRENEALGRYIDVSEEGYEARMAAYVLSSSGGSNAFSDSTETPPVTHTYFRNAGARYPYPELTGNVHYGDWAIRAGNDTITVYYAEPVTTTTPFTEYTRLAGTSWTSRTIDEPGKPAPIPDDMSEDDARRIAAWQFAVKNSDKEWVLPSETIYYNHRDGKLYKSYAPETGALTEEYTGYTGNNPASVTADILLFPVRYEEWTLTIEPMTLVDGSLEHLTLNDGKYVAPSRTVKMLANDTSVRLLHSSYAGYELVGYYVSADKKVAEADAATLTFNSDNNIGKGEGKRQILYAVYKKIGQYEVWVNYAKYDAAEDIDLPGEIHYTLLTTDKYITIADYSSIANIVEYRVNRTKGDHYDMTYSEGNPAVSTLQSSRRLDLPDAEDGDEFQVFIYYKKAAAVRYTVRDRFYNSSGGDLKYIRDKDGKNGSITSLDGLNYANDDSTFASYETYTTPEIQRVRLRDYVLSNAADYGFVYDPVNSKLTREGDTQYINIAYKRVTYRLYFDLNGGAVNDGGRRSHTKASISVKYGQPLVGTGTLPDADDMEYSGYTLAGWNIYKCDDLTLTKTGTLLEYIEVNGTGYSGTQTVPNYNIIAEAEWTPATSAPVTIEVWRMRVDADTNRSLYPSGYLHTGEDGDAKAYRDNPAAYEFYTSVELTSTQVSSALALTGENVVDHSMTNDDVLKLLQKAVTDSSTKNKLFTNSDTLSTTTEQGYTIPRYSHFTYNGGVPNAIVGSQITADGRTIVKVYYARDIITINFNNLKGEGSVKFASGSIYVDMTSGDFTTSGDVPNVATKRVQSYNGTSYVYPGATGKLFLDRLAGRFAGYTSAKKVKLEAQKDFVYLTISLTKDELVDLFNLYEKGVAVNNKEVTNGNHIIYIKLGTKLVGGTLLGMTLSEWNKSIELNSSSGSISHTSSATDEDSFSWYGLYQEPFANYVSYSATYYGDTTTKSEAGMEADEYAAAYSQKYSAHNYNWTSMSDIDHENARWQYPSGIVVSYLSYFDATELTDGNVLNLTRRENETTITYYSVLEYTDKDKDAGTVPTTKSVRAAGDVTTSAKKLDYFGKEEAISGVDGRNLNITDKFLGYKVESYTEEGAGETNGYYSNKSYKNLTDVDDKVKIDNELKVYHIRRTYKVELMNCEGVADKYCLFEGRIKDVLPSATSMAGKAPSNLDSDYIFAGWSFSNSINDRITNSDYMPAANIQVYAIWEKPSVEVTAHIENGTWEGSTTKTFTVGKDDVLNDSTKNSAHIELPTAVTSDFKGVNSSYSFVGWYTDAEHTQAFNPATPIDAYADPVTGELKFDLYGLWYDTNTVIVRISCIDDDTEYEFYREEHTYSIGDLMRISAPIEVNSARGTLMNTDYYTDPVEAAAILQRPNVSPSYIYEASLTFDPETNSSDTREVGRQIKTYTITYLSESQLSLAYTIRYNYMLGGGVTLVKSQEVSIENTGSVVYVQDNIIGFTLVNADGTTGAPTAYTIRRNNEEINVYYQLNVDADTLGLEDYDEFYDGAKHSAIKSGSTNYEDFLDSISTLGELAPTVSLLYGDIASDDGVKDAGTYPVTLKISGTDAGGAAAEYTTGTLATVTIKKRTVYVKSRSATIDYEKLIDEDNDPDGDKILYYLEGLDDNYELGKASQESAHGEGHGFIAAECPSKASDLDGYASDFFTFTQAEAKDYNDNTVSHDNTFSFDGSAYSANYTFETVSGELTFDKDATGAIGKESLSSTIPAGARRMHMMSLDDELLDEDAEDENDIYYNPDDAIYYSDEELTTWVASLSEIPMLAAYNEETARTLIEALYAGEDVRIALPRTVLDENGEAVETTVEILLRAFRDEYGRLTGIDAVESELLERLEAEASERFEAAESMNEPLTPEEQAALLDEAYRTALLFSADTEGNVYFSLDGRFGYDGTHFTDRETGEVISDITGLIGYQTTDPETGEAVDAAYALTAENAMRFTVGGEKFILSMSEETGGYSCEIVTVELPEDAEADAVLSTEEIFTAEADGGIAYAADAVDDDEIEDDADVEDDDDEDEDDDDSEDDDDTAIARQSAASKSRESQNDALPTTKKDDDGDDDGGDDAGSGGSDGDDTAIDSPSDASQPEESQTDALPTTKKDDDGDDDGDDGAGSDGSDGDGTPTEGTGE